MRIIANRYSDDNLDPQQAEEDSRVEQAKNKAKNKVKDTARQLATDAKKRKQFIDIITKIVSIIAKFWPVFVALLVIIMIIGFVAFMESMPGLMQSKITEVGKSIWSKIHGYFTGDSITPSVTDEEIVGVAEYLQNMGYDISGYGFGDVTYEEDYDGQVPPTSVGQTKHIKKVTPYADKKNYIQAYIAANESTYALATWSVGGAWRAWIDFLTGTEWTGKTISENARDYSTGMINIDGLTGHELEVNPLGPMPVWRRHFGWWN